jgi:hypothetical protein
MANKQKFSVEQATQLRLQGHSNQSISEILGCSVHWCVKNLKGVERGIGTNVDATKLQAIAILEEALEKVRAL